MAVSFLKADHHMAHDCIGRIGEWLPHCLNVPMHQKAQLFPHTVPYIDRVDFVVTWRVCCCYLFLLLPSFISFHGPYSLRYWCLFLGTLKELIFDSVFCLQSRVAHFLPSSRLLDLEKIAVLSRVVFSFVTAALKSRWSHSTGVQITQQQALKNKTAGDFRAF